jgi:hypothetical protein
MKNLCFVSFTIFKSKTMRWAECVARIAGIRNACKGFVGKNERKILLGKSRIVWEDNIQMDPREFW